MEKWHTLPLSEVGQKLGTNLHSGLTRGEAEERLESYGSNELPEGRVESPFVIFLRQFQSPLIYVLFAASVIVLALGDAVDSGIIMAVLVFNAILGTAQEGKAQSTLLALKKFAESRAAVIRGGEELIVLDREIVPGDVIVLQEGDGVPADARVVESRTLRVAEAALTGESVPVHKEEAMLDNPDLPESEQVNMVFKGTAVVSGRGKAVVAATGSRTVIGRISQAVAAVDTEIPLKKDIRALSGFIVKAIAVISVGFFFAGLYFGYSARHMLATVVSLAVSIIPEGLPVVLTLVLASGVWRMAKRRALVKKLQAVEALGQAKVIAVDKTGTITKNELVIREVFVDGQIFRIGGSGYEPRGEVRLGENVVDPANHSDLLLAGKIAAFCANARAVFSEEDKVWRVAGDPTEAAMAVFAEKAGFHKSDLERESPLVHEIPFDYKTKYHVTVHKVKEGEFVTVAGAPEAILEVAEKMFVDGKKEPLTKEKRKETEKVFHDMSERGLRTVAFAYSENPPPHKQELAQISLKGLIFAGFYGMVDALRPEVADAVSRAREAGIKVVMITGDHKLTALAVAGEAGIWREGDKVLTGEEINILHKEALAQELPDVSVFARVTPDHKMKIIEAYRKRGEVVAMTGDGVNDAPSLVAADLGVAMGKIGTEVAKEASDIVLLDDNFGSIVSAIDEGRNMFKTIQKTVLFLISTSVGEVLVIAGAIFVGLPLPLLPAQIIWLNLVTDPFIGAALAMEPKERGLLKKKFRRPRRGVIDELMIRRTIIMSLPMMIGTFYLFGQYYDLNLVKAQTAALTVLAVFQWFNVWNCRSEDGSVFGKRIFTNKPLIGATALVIVLQVLAVYAPPLQKLLGTTALSLQEWGIIILVAASILVAEEARKAHAAISGKHEDINNHEREND